MSVADSLPGKREEAPSQHLLALHTALLCQSGVCGNTLENIPIPLLLTKSKTLTRLSWMIYSKSAELQSQPFLSPFSPPAVWWFLF